MVNCEHTQAQRIQSRTACYLLFMIHDIQLQKSPHEKYVTFKMKNLRTLRNSFQNL